MKVITEEIIEAVLARAAVMPRRRTNLNLHAELSDPINRFINAGFAGSYIRPHRHRAKKWEIVNVLQGQLDVLIFSSEGVLQQRRVLAASGVSLVEISGGEWHSFIFHPPRRWFSRSSQAHMNLNLTRSLRGGPRRKVRLIRRRF
jgi:cupin fold WbuC family metalloprotein